MSSFKLIILSAAILVFLVCIEFLLIQFNLFGYFPHIGILLHVVGGCFSGLLLYGLVKDSLVKNPVLIQFIFVLGSVAIAAIVWEGFEWGVGMFLGHKMQGSIDNIMLDLCTSMIGGILACVSVLILRSKN